MRFLIAGVDPGTSVGYSLVDLEGTVIVTGSHKELSLGDLLSLFIKKGSVVIVGTDKHVVPSFIEKIRSKLGVRVISPKKDLLVNEKRMLTKEYETKNAHEMDALASALFAYERMKPLLKKIKRLTSDNTKLHDAVLKEALKPRNSKGIERIITEYVEGKKVPVTQPIKPTRPVDYKVRFERELKTRIKVERDLHLLKKSYLGIKKKEKDLKKKLHKALKKRDMKQKQPDYTKPLRAMEQENKRLRQRNKKLLLEKKEVETCLKFSNDGTVIKKIRTLGLRDIKEICKGDIIFVDNPTIFSQKSVLNIQDKVQCILTRHKTPNYVFPFPIYQASFPVLFENEEFMVVKNEELTLLEKDVLKTIVKKYKSDRNHSSL